MAFVQMVRIAAAVFRHRGAGMPYLVYLRNPSTGGVFASWGSIGHVTLAEPGALIGFVGPRVYEVLEGSPLPEGMQTSENLVEHGIVDAVVSPADLPYVMVRILDVLATFGDVLPSLPPSPRVLLSTRAPASCRLSSERTSTSTLVDLSPSRLTSSRPPLLPSSLMCLVLSLPGLPSPLRVSSLVPTRRTAPSSTLSSLPMSLLPA